MASEQPPVGRHVASDLGMEQLLSTPVSDIMTTQIEMVSDTVPIRYAAKLLLDKHIAGLPVTSEEGRLIGVISWIDIMKAFRVKPRGAALAGDPLRGFYTTGDVHVIHAELPLMEGVPGKVGDYMSRMIIAVAPDAAISQAIRVMTEGKVHRVLVVDENDNLAGVVSAVDIVHHLAALDPVSQAS